MRFPGASRTPVSSEVSKPGEAPEPSVARPLFGPDAYALITGFPLRINNATKMLPTGNQNTELRECFKYSSPHAHPSFPFRDQSSSF